ncbi:hypothetical protein [Parasitella parasitica]|uniref:F-box domain-containing protein n=1 Tax=Parasitella parasitica TaxID=35722 RepID=A0A0B7MSU2_9FUNG|nr:hypothetical protein [Parasitella parasitica]
MLKLSNEILIKIFGYLTVPEKRTCASVCEKWRCLILGGIFYQDLQVYGEENLLLLNKHFEENVPHRNLVQSLRASQLYARAPLVNTILALPKQFPRLREFVYEHHDSDTYESDESKIVIDEDIAKHWQGITKFYHYDKYLVSSKLLKYGGFRNLVELGVSFGGKERSAFKCDALIQHLSNAPKLKMLKLGRGAMSLSHLHQLHCNAKQLEVLRFSDMELEPIVGDRQQPLISHSDTLKELQFLECTEEYNKSMLEHMEYPNLKILEARLRDILQGDYCEDQLVKFVSHCPHIKTYNVNIHQITPAIMNAMDASGIKLKKITITQLPYTHPLEQLKILHASDQKNSISTMTLDYSDYCGKEPLNVSTMFTLMSKFTKLKHFESFGRRLPDFPLGEFLYKFQDMETLKLKDWGIRVGPNPLHGSIFKRKKELKTKLKSLTLVNVTCCEESMSFISETCPELSKLTILEQFSRDFRDIEFPNHNFESITLKKMESINNYDCNLLPVAMGRSNDDPYNHTGFHYQVTDDKGTKWYKIVGGIQEKTFFEECPKSENIRMISVKYKSCATLKLGDAYI